MFGTYNSMGYDTIYVLGAGFSVPAGLPLSDRLLPLVFRKAYETRTPDCDSKWGHAQLLLDALNFYCPGIRFSPKAILDGRVPKRFNFERFLTYVSAISATQAGTTEFVDEHGNQQLSYFKAWSAQVIQELEKESMIRGLPTMYSQFALNLKTSIVLTFNWDTILESILFASGIEFQLDRKRLTLPPAVMLHKLHGVGTL
ncbi:MAG: hypothetical protein JNK74_10395 [Candidatus Hydrogenedentes bacterium]|nr:hypothetical protein [Candidatus Hydrogenedentota bacterium]